MRIAMVSRTVPPVDWGGIQVHVRGLSEALARLGHEVHLFISGSPKVEGVRVHPLRTFSTPGLTLGYYVSIALSSAKAVSSANVDVVHGHSMYAFGVARKKNRPLVVTIHGTQVGEVRSQVSSGMLNPNHLITDSVSAVMEGYASRMADRVIVVSKANREELMEHYDTPAEKIKVVPNGVWVDNFTVSDMSRRDIVFIGRLHERKGIDRLIGAMPSVLKEHKDVRLVVIGGGELDGQLRRETKRLGIEGNVVFTGRIGEEEKMEFLSHASLFVMPSHYEGFGIVMLEGMASGLPVVATPVGAVEDIIINGRNGRITTHDTLAEDIIAMLDDDKALRRMGHQARKDVETKYDWPVVARKTVEVYREVLD